MKQGKGLQEFRDCGVGAPNFWYICFTTRAILTAFDWFRRLDSSSERIPTPNSKTKRSKPRQMTHLKAHWIKKPELRIFLLFHNEPQMLVRKSTQIPDGFPQFCRFPFLYSKRKENEVKLKAAQVERECRLGEHVVPFKCDWTLPGWTDQRINEQRLLRVRGSTSNGRGIFEL